MRQVAAAVSAARDDQCTVLLVEGEAGIGKSRLLSEAAQQYVVPGDIVLHGQAVELSGGDIPYGVVADMLRGLRRLQLGVGRTLDPAVRTSLEDLLTTLTGGETPRLDRGLLLDSFVTLVETLGHGRLVWWVVEDLHWSDTSSRDVLSYLIRAVGPAQLLVTMTVRTGEPWTDDLQEFVAETIRYPQVSRLSLRPLSGTELVDQIHQLAAGPVASPVLERVRRLGEGNPFWTEELVLGGLDGTGPVPESVRGLIGTRLLGLGDATRAVVEAVSVVDHADHALLPRVCDLPELEVDWACAEAVAHHVLRVDDDGQAFRFRHTLLREAVAHALLPGRRRRLHRAWATALDEAAGDGPDSSFRIEAAHQWAQAGDPEKALTSAYAAALLAHQASGRHEETRLLRRVLDLWSRVPDAESLLGTTRSNVAVRAIATLFAAGQYEDCLQVIERELERERDPVATIYLRLRRNVVLEELAREQDEAATDSLADAIETLRSADPDNPWLPPALVMCAYYLSDDDAATAIELCERAAATAREQGELQAELAALDALSWSQANLGRFDDAIETLQNGVQLSRDTAPDWASMLGGSLSWYLWSQGRYPAAVEAARAAMHYIRRPQVAWERTAWLAESLAEALISLGDWDEAKRVLDDAVGVPLAGQAAVTVHCLTGLLAVRRGDVAAAREHLAVARRHTPPQEDALLSQRLPPRWLSAEIAASERDLDTVRSTLAPLWESPHPEVVSESIWRPMLLLARLEADDATLGGTRRAADPASWTALDQVTERLHRLGPTGEAWRCQLAAERSRANGEHDLRGWEAVVDAWTALGQKPEQGYALARAAECHARSGDRATAVELLTAAGAIAEQLGAAPLATEVAGLSRRLRLGVKSSMPHQRQDGNGRVGSLTPREVEVLALVAEGLDNAGVAQRLVISSKTASVHVSNILAKLGASSRTQAASMALRQGLITIEPEDSN